MAVATETAELSPPELSPKESFAALLDESLGVANGLEGTVVKGRVISIENDAALIDVGLKSEGRVALKEFAAPGAAPSRAIAMPRRSCLPSARGRPRRYRRHGYPARRRGRRTRRG